MSDPLIEPVSVEWVKEQARIRDAASDALLGRYITAARAYVENNTGHFLVQRDFTEYRPEFGAYLELYRVPVAAVVSVGYIDGQGAPATFDGYQAQLNIAPARIYPGAGAWPLIAAGSEISIAYTAGYAVGDEPPELLQAVVMLVAHWFAVREPLDGQTGATEIPLTVSALCEQLRVPWL